MNPPSAASTVSTTGSSASWTVPPHQQQQQQAAMPPPPQQQQQTAPAAARSVSVVTPPPMPSRMDQLEQKVLVTRTADEESEDGRIQNPEAMTKIRDAWVYKQVRARVKEFTSYKQALLFCGTWNVNAKGKEEPLDEFICSEWGQNQEYAPDIVAVGFQEIVDLNAVNVAVDNKTQQRAQFWTERLRMTLNNPATTSKTGGYTLIHQQAMVGLLVCVFIKNVHGPRVKYVASHLVGVGVMGMMGNKGGVAVRLQFYDSTLCVVCSHLAAHRENVVGRNADFANVLSKLSFEVGTTAVHQVIRNGSMSQWSSGSSSVGVQDHDICIWLGDLNYRIDESMPTEQVLKLSEARQLDALIPLDQLNLERAEGRVFAGFSEGALTFPPTYKYQPGTDVYEQRPEKKLRAPAWCDRILWMTQEPTYIQQLSYRRSETPNVSDHKPVYSTMRMVVKDVNVQAREAIYRELMQLLDRYENQTMPMVGLSTNTIDFGLVRYKQAVTVPIQITNTGNVVAKFRFVPKLDENTLCKSWLTVTPTYGLLIPGEAPLTIHVRMTMDNATAQALNSGREVLEDILILRLESGRDYYLTVQGQYARSCFGMTLDDLVLHSDPIRQVPLDALEAKDQISNPAQALCVPKELWRLVDAIAHQGLTTPNIWDVTYHNAAEVAAIREALDTGAPLPPCNPHGYTECLQQFCAALAAPIVSTAFFPTTEVNPENIQALARQFLQVLPPIHYNVFVYLVSFFREILIYRDQNQMTAAKLARVLLDCCTPPTPESNMQRRAGMQLILMHLLETSSI